MPRLTSIQKSRLARLEPALRKCVKTANFKAAKEFAYEIQTLLGPTGHQTRVLQAKNWLFECALEAGELEFAMMGFEGTLQRSSPKTRLHLEATVFLAICNLRKGNIAKSKALLRNAIAGLKNISSPRRRHQFHARLISRLREECVLATLIEAQPETLNVDEIQEAAVLLVRSKTEDEMLELLGNALPSKATFLIGDISKFYLREVPEADKKLLGSSASEIKPKEAGLSVKAALHRVCWRAVCDPNNDVYKAWAGGLSIVYDKKYLTSALLMAMQSWKISSCLLAMTFVALVIKLGAATFCEIYVPNGLMIHTSEKEKKKNQQS